MVAALLNAKGQAAANALASTLPITITSTTALSALISSMFASPAGTRSVGSAGSTWATAFDDANKRATWAAIPATAGTTTVTPSNGGTNADITAFVAEFTGLKTAGATQATARKNSTGTTWTTDALLLTQDSLVICVSVETGGSAQTSTTTGSGFSVLTGTGITAGAIANANEGHVMHISWGNFTSGQSPVGGGTWSASVPQDCWLVAFELAPAGGGGGSSSSALLLLL